MGRVSLNVALHMVSDSIIALAKCALDYKLCQPEVVDEDAIEVIGGRWGKFPV